MKKMNGLAILMLLAALPAAALDWNQGDPAAHWRTSLSAAPASLSGFISRPPSGGGGVAGQFDSYVLTLTWTAAFCAGKPGLPECVALAPDQFAARNLALHGLWPNKDGDASHTYGYCGVDAATRALDRAATWCKMPALGLSKATMSRLTETMPGTASCLQNHEWYKHGSCSGFAPEQYFTRASDLVTFVAQTGLGRYLTAHSGETVTAQALLAAFESEFGSGSGSRVSLTCTKVSGAELLLEVRLRLAHPLRPASELGNMLLPAGGAGNCPASFKLAAAG